METLDFLDQRASVRTFDPGDELSEALIQEMLYHASFAPSSNNFQPWKVLAIKNKKIQKILSEISGKQQQVADASVVFLLYGDSKEYDLDKQIAFELESRILTPEIAEARKNRIYRYLELHPEDKGNEGLRLDVGLFGMNLMHVVRTFGYDSVPMRGTNFNEIHHYLDVPKDWEPILMLPVGIAVKKGHIHVRKLVDNFATIIN